MNKDVNSRPREIAFNNIDLPKNKEEREEMIHEIKVTLYSLLYYATYKTSRLPEKEKNEIIKNSEDFTIEEMIDYLREEKSVPDKRLQNRIDDIMDYLDKIQNDEDLKHAAFTNISSLSFFFKQGRGNKLFMDIFEKGVRLNIEDAVWEAVTNPRFLTDKVEKIYTESWVKLYEKYYGNERTF